MDLNDYFYFVHVVEKRGFAPAGRALDVPKSRLSRHVRQLEDRLGTRLIQRTSRQFTVTDAGEAFYRHARAALDEVEAAEASVLRQTKMLSGSVRLSCSVGVAQFAVREAVSTFLGRNPDVKIIQQVTNQTVDLIESGVDMAIRGHTGPLPDSSLIQSRLTPVEWHLFAGHRYLKKHGVPASPQDLENHAGLKLGWRPEYGHWILRGQDETTVSVPFEPRLCSDDMVTLKEVAADGMGIVALPAYVCRPDVERGRLMRVLPNWTAGDAQLSLLMPSRRGLPPAVEAFAGFLREAVPVICAA
ncbi:LysR substrate-binding domain-containing protein [Hyphobacterium sp. HN65]|uniref:LysR substrate-binding domain-containing protein n=1 Tax=Hyphobacterium lacteum TaxID=3116575 RepID=A0ABU7LP15_9PROT|nr:LysR substrate-binding domain-containing protein [Hyphobacterium sp. HN65]MEE2525637.1 LysR substrate-binding domain-containing protein [Hyphobacterium sp. HN65]